MDIGAHVVLSALLLFHWRFGIICVPIREGRPIVNMGRSLISRKEENDCINDGLLSARCSCVRGVGVAGTLVLDYLGICISPG